MLALLVGVMADRLDIGVAIMSIKVDRFEWKHVKDRGLAGNNGLTLGAGGGGLADEVYCYCWFVASGLP